VFGVQAGLGKQRHQFGEQLAFEFDAAAHGSEDFDKRKVLVVRGLQIGVAGVKAEVFSRELNGALELVCRGTPEATEAAWTASSTLDLKAADFGLQTVRVTSGMAWTGGWLSGTNTSATHFHSDKHSGCSTCSTCSI